MTLDQRNEPEPASSGSSCSSDHDGPSPPVLHTQVQIFSTNDLSGWTLKKRKVRAPHRNAGISRAKKNWQDSSSGSGSSGPRALEDGRSRKGNLANDGRDEDLEAASASSAKFHLAILPSVASPTREHSTPGQTIFDVFHETPQPLTIEEQNFVMKWLLYAAALAYGSNGSGPFCPSRDAAWRSVSTFPSGLSWALIDCDTFSSLTQDKPLPPRLHRRKAMAYQYIAKLLADPRTQTSDEAINCVCSAIAVESRSLNPEVNRMHLKGLAQMIAKRGVDTLFTTVCFMFHPMFCLGYLVMAELESTTMLEVRACSDRFSRMLEIMQGDTQRREVDVLDRSDATVGESPDSASEDQHSVDVSPISWPSVTGRPLIHETILSFLTACMRDEPLQRKISRFINAYLLNLMLWDCQNSPETGKAFLRRLSYLIRYSVARVEVIMVWVVAKAWIDVDATSNRKDGGPRKEVYLTETVIDALKVFSRISDDSKDKLITTLTSWLPGVTAQQMKGTDAADVGVSVDSVDVAGLSTTAAIEAEKNDVKIRREVDYCKPPHLPSGMKYLTTHDLQAVKEEACSDWYEKNVSKKPMPPSLPVLKASLKRSSKG